MSLLEMRRITKTYGRVVANDDVSLRLEEGEILCIVGENGAGKSTLMKVLYGLEHADAGEILLKGRQVRFRSPSDAIRLGIGMVQQHFMLFTPMTVAENIAFGREVARLGFYDRRANAQRVRELSGKYSLAVDPQARIEDCPVGIQQRVEILKTLYQNAEIIIFDEPSAVLTPGEVDELLSSMRVLAGMGKSLILITHKLGEVMAVADRVMVMRDGRKVAERLRGETSAEELSRLMIGRRTVPQTIEAIPPGREVLKVDRLSLGGEHGKKTLDNVSLTVREGEIVGVAGVSGNGQTELVRCVTGLESAYLGSVVICGRDVSRAGVSRAREAGLSFIPEDRYIWGSAGEATLEENALMGSEDDQRFSNRSVLKRGAVFNHARRLVEQYGVKADSVKQRFRELSGGNAQKLVAAREMERNLPLLVACEPTRGIDIGAMEFIHRQFINRRVQGGGILLISSELSEIMKLSDRICVIYGGKIMHMFERGEADSHKLGILMLGGQLRREA